MSSAVVPGDDPRDASAEAPLSLPEKWQTDSFDALSSSMMFVSGLIMVTRNRYLAWPSLLLSINSVINQHPLRMKEGAQSNISVIMLGIGALIASYLPLILIGPAAKRPRRCDLVEVLALPGLEAQQGMRQERHASPNVEEYGTVHSAPPLRVA
ncbi:hypothetical protein VTO73DRAFT_12529 [Trametes versicolor]